MALVEFQVRRKQGVDVGLPGLVGCQGCIQQCFCLREELCAVEALPVTEALPAGVGLPEQGVELQQAGSKFSTAFLQLPAPFVYRGELPATAEERQPNSIPALTRDVPVVAGAMGAGR